MGNSVAIIIEQFCIINISTYTKPNGNVRCVIGILQSQANLEVHEENIHGVQNYMCSFCGNYFELESQLLKRLTSHKRYAQAQKAGLMCKYCHQKVMDFYSHNPSCKHNPKKSGTKFLCRNEGCTSQFSMVKHRNYHEKKRCKHLKG